MENRPLLPDLLVPYLGNERLPRAVAASLPDTASLTLKDLDERVWSRPRAEVEQLEHGVAAVVRQEMWKLANAHVELFSRGYPIELLPVDRRTRDALQDECGAVALRLPLGELARTGHVDGRFLLQIVRVAEAVVIHEAATAFLDGLATFRTASSSPRAPTAKDSRSPSVPSTRTPAGAQPRSGLRSARYPSR